MFKRILIANRGEIAVRIIRACRELNLETVVVYSDADADSLAVQMANRAVRIGEAPPSESYLKAARIVEVAKQTECDAIHPGFGFLAENADFAAMAQHEGLIFIGPEPHAIRVMGDKTAALEAVRAVGVPTLPNFREAAEMADYIAAAERLGYPLLVKAAAGGGGKGMRVVRDSAELAAAIEAASREAAKAFGDARIFLEKYIDQARHIEFQIFADAHGNTLHLFERECSVQRRHQKIIEESPSPYLQTHPELREKMAAAAIKAAESVQYRNAGTVEFLVDVPSGNFYFLEMNTRLQVEHPVTEAVLGRDLVQLQLQIAAGGQIPFTQAEVSQRGHAIEARIYAEDAAQNFLPSTGKLLHIAEPQGPGIRVDSGVRSGDSITLHYDPMIAKLIVQAESREAALRRMDAALAEYVVLGVTTNIRFLRELIAHPDFKRGETTTNLIERYFSQWEPAFEPVSDTVLIAAVLGVIKNASAMAMQNTVHLSEARESDPYSPWARRDGFRNGG